MSAPTPTVPSVSNGPAPPMPKAMHRGIVKQVRYLFIYLRYLIYLFEILIYLLEIFIYLL